MRTLVTDYELLRVPLVRQPKKSGSSTFAATEIKTTPNRTFVDEPEYGKLNFIMRSIVHINMVNFRGPSSDSPRSTHRSPGSLMAVQLVDPCIRLGERQYSPVLHRHRKVRARVSVTDSGGYFGRLLGLTPPAPLPSMAGVALLETLEPGAREQAELLHRHVHELVNGTPPDAAPGTGPKPEYDLGRPAQGRVCFRVRSCQPPCDGVAG